MKTLFDAMVVIKLHPWKWEVILITRKIVNGDRNMKLKIVLEKGMDGFIVAYCPALKGCVTQGRTEEQAIKNIKEAIELYLETPPQDIQRPAEEYKVYEIAL
jgi:predicted RNase H-like HicB family nuclease